MKTNVVNVVKAMVKGVKLARLFGGKFTGVWFSNDWKTINEVYDVRVTDRYGKKTDIRIRCIDNLWLIKVDDVLIQEIAMF